MKLVRRNDPAQPKNRHACNRTDPHQHDAPAEIRGDRRTERMQEREEKRAGRKVHAEIRKQLLELRGDADFELRDHAGPADRRRGVERAQVATLRRPSAGDRRVSREPERVPAHRIVPDQPRKRHHEHRREHHKRRNAARLEIHQRKHKPAEKYPDRQPVGKRHQPEEQPRPKKRQQRVQRLVPVLHRVDRQPHRSGK